MIPSPRQAGPSLLRNEGNNHNTFSERHYTLTAAEDAHQGQYFDGATGGYPNAGGLQRSHDLEPQRYGNTNDFSQYHASNVGFEAAINDMQDPHTSEPFPPLAPWESHGLVRGASNYLTSVGSGTQSLEAGRGDNFFPREIQSPFMMPHRSVSVVSASPTPALMQSSPEQLLLNYTTSTSEQEVTRQTKYEPFQCRFDTPEHARDHRRLGTRFHREPYIPPETDESIAEIEAHRQRHVERIYDAMTSGELAKDNNGSIAMKRWVLDAHYPPDLVEAYAHKVFDCLLQQAKEGFRGWIHNDYVADERKGEIHDKEVNCAQRLDNIISALQQEKTICEDVMNSACQIRMFVNAPTAYANRKHQNRVGNSKRGRTKDTPDANPKPMKVRRTGARQTRARSATASDLPESRRSTSHEQQLQPIQQMPTTTPYFGMSQPTAPSPTLRSYAAPRSTPLQRTTTPAQRGWMNVGSPAAPLPHNPQTYTPRMHPVPHLGYSPCPTSPLVSYGHFSAPATPEEVTPVGLGEQGSVFGGMHGKPAIDPILSQWDIPDTQGVEGRPSFFGQHEGTYVSLAQLEQPQGMLGGDDFKVGEAFNGWWNENRGIQQMPNGSQSAEDPSQS
jgi:hypothetical protein